MISTVDIRRFYFTGMPSQWPKCLLNAIQNPPTGSRPRSLMERDGLLLSSRLRFQLKRRLQQDSIELQTRFNDPTQNQGKPLNLLQNRSINAAKDQQDG